MDDFSNQHAWILNFVPAYHFRLLEALMLLQFANHKFVVSFTEIIFTSNKLQKPEIVTGWVTDVMMQSLNYFSFKFVYVTKQLLGVWQFTKKSCPATVLSCGERLLFSYTMSEHLRNRSGWGMDVLGVKYAMRTMMRSFSLRFAWMNLIRLSSTSCSLFIETHFHFFQYFWCVAHN